MSQARAIIKNSLVTYAAQAVEIIVGLVWLSLVGRYLGQEWFGRYAFLFVLLHILIAISDSGVNSLLSRDIVKDRENAARNFGAAVLIRTVFTAAALLLLGLAYFISYESLSWKLAPEVIAAVLLFTVSHFSVRTSTTIFWAFERMEFEALIKILNSVCMLALIFAVKRWDLGFSGVFAALALSKFTAAFTGWTVRSVKFIRPAFPRDMKLIKYYMVEGLPLGISALVRKSYGQVDTFMLSLLKDFSAVGIFNGAYRFIQRITMLPILINRPLFPALTRLANSSVTDMSFFFQKIFKVMVIISLSLAIFIVFLSEDIIFLLFGNEFAGSAVALKLLAPVVFLMFINVLFGFALVSLQKQRIYTYGMVSCFIVNLLLDIALIPGYGYKGACVANVASESVMTGILYFHVRGLMPAKEMTRLLVRPVSVAGITGLVLYYSRSADLLIVLPAAAALYLLLTVAFRSFTKADIKQLRGVLRKVRTGAAPS